MRNESSPFTRWFLMAAGIFVMGLPFYRFLLSPAAVKLAGQIALPIIIIAGAIIASTYWRSRQGQRETLGKDENRKQMLRANVILAFGIAILILSPFSLIALGFLQIYHLVDIPYANWVGIMILIGLAGLGLVTYWAVTTVHLVGPRK